MAGHALGRRHIDAEAQVANKSSDRYGQHDPAVVCHEEQPAACKYLAYTPSRTFSHIMKKL